MKKLACLFITLSIRNVESSYSQRIKPWPIWIDQSWRFFISGPQSRANRPRTSIFYQTPAAKSSSKLPSPGITLRCNHSTSHLWIEDREGLLFFRNPGGRFRAFLGSGHAFRARAKHRFLRQNFINFSVSWTGCWVAYNFLISKRQALISRQDQAMTYSNWSILRISQNMTLCER